MKGDRRWIDATSREAARTKMQLPWSRGARRAAWIAKRAAAVRPAPRLAKA